MSVKLQTDYYLEFLSLKGGCTCSSESTLVKATLMEITCRGPNNLASRSANGHVTAILVAILVSIHWTKPILEFGLELDESNP